MEILIQGQEALLSVEDFLVQNSVEIYDVYFKFSDESWDGFTQTAVFRSRYICRSVNVIDGHCTVPPECLINKNEMLEVGIYGVCGSKKKPTIWCCAGKIHEGVRPREVSTPPSPTLYDQIMNELADTRQNVADQLLEHDAHPPIPGQNGYWLIWNSELDQYVESASPLPEPCIPHGGKTGYVLAKKSDDDFQTEWVSVAVGEDDIAIATDALEALAECGILAPAYQDGVFYTDTDGAIYVL